MAYSQLSDLQNLQRNLIRRALQGSVFIAPVSSPPPTSLTTGTPPQLNVLPDGYVDVGWIDASNGVSWDRKVTVDSATGWGSVQPVRSDINEDDETLKFTMLETKRETLQLYYGVDLSSTTGDSATGEVSFAQALRPQSQYFRLLAVFADGFGTNQIWVARFLPNAMVIDMDTAKWTNKDSSVTYGVTVQGFPDDTLGYAVSHYIGGPGWQGAAQQAAGF